MAFSRASARITLGCALSTLAGCATYTQHPLDLHAEAKNAVSDLRHGETLPARLALADVERLTLDNNPELVAVRAQRGIAEAQLRTAGILPNPVLNMSYADVLSGPGTFAALAGGLAQDLKALVTLSSRRHAADAAAQSVDAAVLWQEWQTVGKARLAAVDVIKGEKQLTLLRSNAALWRERLQRNRQALEQGDATLVTLAPDVVAGSDAQKQFDDFERAQKTRRRDLNALLGLSPTAVLDLTEDVILPPVDADAIRSQLPDLVNRRPDLIALQLGYRSQEEKVRGAVLAQFPLFSLGYAYGRDTSNVRTLGPQITMDLPVFDRNQGNISQEQATREQLHAEFNARLIAAKSEVEGLLADQALLQGQLAGKRALLEQMAPVAERAQVAFRQGDIDERSYVDLVAAHNLKQQEILALQLVQLEQQVAIATLIGAGMPHTQMPGTNTQPPVAGGQTESAEIKP
jgi:outer membrane protein TolC